MMKVMRSREENGDKLNYKEVVEYIYDIPRFTKKNKLENTKVLIERLLPKGHRAKVIHVAGTNGKGSVCAFIAGIFRKSQIRTGLFTSPHLVRVNERFQINGEEVSDEELVDTFLQVLKAVKELKEEGYEHPTFFEFIFVMALLIFEYHEVEYMVIETGLGGRLDATNALEDQDVTVITSISLEHTEFLGNTIEKIAAEKAGIIKDYTPVIYDASSNKAGKVIEEIAKEHSSKMIPVSEKSYKYFMNDGKTIDFLFHSQYYGNIQLHIQTIAKYQVMNASLAVEAVGAADKDKRITTEMIREGLAHTIWKGRMEEAAPKVFFDGAHNSAGIAEFVKTARQFAGKERITILFAAVKEKNYQDMIQKICQEIPMDAVVVTQVGGAREVEAETQGLIFQKYTEAPVYIENDIEKAYKEALAKQEEGILFCVGSLYLIGELETMIRRN
jgi:dihydrofolate synthase/folylpolyglutamate synthase